MITKYILHQCPLWQHESLLELNNNRRYIIFCKMCTNYATNFLYLTKQTTTCKILARDLSIAYLHFIIKFHY